MVCITLLQDVDVTIVSLRLNGQEASWYSENRKIFLDSPVSKKNSMGRATGFEDKTQGTLFFDVCRILKEKRPKAFMLENVKNLCSHDKGRTFQVIRESLDELGYEIFYKVLDGQNYVPQHRERLMTIAERLQEVGRRKGKREGRQETLLWTICMRAVTM